MPRCAFAGCSAGLRGLYTTENFDCRWCLSPAPVISTMHVIALQLRIGGPRLRWPSVPLALICCGQLKAARVFGVVWPIVMRQAWSLKTTAQSAPTHLVMAACAANGTQHAAKRAKPDQKKGLSMWSSRLYFALGRHCACAVKNGEI
jgi:hypothetical protein